MQGHMKAPRMVLAVQADGLKHDKSPFLEHSWHARGRERHAALGLVRPAPILPRLLKANFPNAQLLVSCRGETMFIM